MTRSTVAFGLLLTLGSLSPMLADTTSLQSILTNVDGTTQTDYTGYNTGGFNETTGIGTLTYTFNPGPGSSFFDVFFDHQLNLPYFNEFGTVNGSPAAGQSYEIGDSDVTNSNPNDTYVHTQNNALDNSNHLPGQTSNFGGACAGATCNGDFAAAMGFSFTLVAGQQEVITLNVSHTNPGGFSLEDTHPVDGTNPTALNLFISGSAVSEPIGVSGVPEPTTTVFLGIGLAVLLVAFRRRLSIHS